MKRIYISDVVHEHIKKEAKERGRTLQWVVEDRLANKMPASEEYAKAWNEGARDFLHVPQIAIPADEDFELKNVRVNMIPPVSKEVKGSTMGQDIPRTADVVKREAYALKDQLEAEKKDSALNQDPDYWDDFNERYKQVDELWAEYHKLKGE